MQMSVSEICCKKFFVFKSRLRRIQMAIKIEISGFDKDFLPVFESLAKSLSKKPILSMFFLIF
ncbi:hypothetical protein EVX84_09690 [Campylobacter coli]|nr:hypothetical protein [Campylobacter coli]EAL8836118.1 hypothetical protein [Campylobacter coli]